MHAPNTARKPTTSRSSIRAPSSGTTTSTRTSTTTSATASTTVYACILGPYGEGNYPLAVPDWIDIGHCHEGYWCADEFAIKAFQRAMEKKYGTVAKLNAAWGITPNSFDEVSPPRRTLRKTTSSPRPSLSIAHTNAAWLDFITWYHQAIIDFAEQSVKTAAQILSRLESPHQTRRQRRRRQSDRLGHLLPGLRTHGRSVRHRPPAGRLPRRSVRR